MSKVTFDKNQFYKPYTRLSAEDVRSLEQLRLKDFKTGENVPLKEGAPFKMVEVKEEDPSGNELVEKFHFIGARLVLTEPQTREITGEVATWDGHLVVAIIPTDLRSNDILNRLSWVGSRMYNYHFDHSDPNSSFMEQHPAIRFGILDNRTEEPFTLSLLEDELRKGK